MQPSSGGRGWLLMQPSSGDTSNELAASTSAAAAKFRKEYLEAMRLVPSAVAIIAVAHEGTRRGLAATAWNSLCADPPSLIACVNQNASAYPFIVKAKAFSLNVLDRAHAEWSRYFPLAEALLTRTASFNPWGKRIIGSTSLSGCSGHFRVRAAQGDRPCNSLDPSRRGCVHPNSKRRSSAVVCRRHLHLRGVHALKGS